MLTILARNKTSWDHSDVFWLVELSC